MHTKNGEVSSVSYDMGMLFTYGYGGHEICWENLEVRWLPADIKGRPTSYNWRTVSRSKCYFSARLALCNKSKSIKKWLTERNIEILSWPANSPDLTPIETVWNDIKKAIRNEKVLPRTETEIKSAITRVWDNFSEYTIDKLITSMLRRCMEVIRQKGFSMKY